MGNYLGSQQHWEDSINQDYDEREQRNNEQVDDRVQPDPRENIQLDLLVRLPTEDFDIHKRILNDAIDGVYKKIDIVISETLEENEIKFVNIEELAKDSVWKVLPDGTKIFTYKNKELLVLYPIENEMKDGKLTLTQKFRKLSA